MGVLHSKRIRRLLVLSLIYKLENIGFFEIRYFFCNSYAFLTHSYINISWFWGTKHVLKGKNIMSFTENLKNTFTKANAPKIAGVAALATTSIVAIVLSSVALGRNNNNNANDNPTEETEDIFTKKNLTYGEATKAVDPLLLKFYNENHSGAYTGFKTHGEFSEIRTKVLHETIDDVKYDLNSSTNETTITDFIFNDSIMYGKSVYTETSKEEQVDNTTKQVVEVKEEVVTTMEIVCKQVTDELNNKINKVFTKKTVKSSASEVTEYYVDNGFTDNNVTTVKDKASLKAAQSMFVFTSKYEFMQEFGSLPGEITFKHDNNKFDFKADVYLSSFQSYKAVTSFELGYSEMVINAVLDDKDVLNGSNAMTSMYEGDGDETFSYTCANSYVRTDATMIANAETFFTTMSARTWEASEEQYCDFDDYYSDLSIGL